MQYSGTSATSGAMRIGLDIGGTKIDALAVDDRDQQLARIRLATGHGVEGVVASIETVLGTLLAEAGRSDIASVGIGIPGFIEPGTTTVRHSVNLGVDELDLGLALAKITQAPIRAENDVKAAALGANAMLGDGRPLAFLNLGTGVAAGIVVDGALWTGSHGVAGEVGHLSIDPNGPACKCGQFGCIEALCGGAAIAARWGSDAHHPVLEMFDAADAGDPRATRLRADMVRGISGAIRAIMLTADVAQVVLGGGLTALGDRLAGAVRAQLQQEAATSAFLRSLHLDDTMVMLPSGSPAAALGAALIGADRNMEGALAHG